jgi:Asp-tRNA(Asn)/Glu-tRNA(Gln) amidotransferase A subunit family amidase
MRRLRALAAQASLPAGGFNFTRHLDPGGLQGARVGVLTQIARLPGTHPGIRGLWEAALQDLQAAGARRL